MPRPTRTLLTIAVAAAAFGWGAAAVRYGLFPWPWMHAAAQRIGALFDHPEAPVGLWHASHHEQPAREGPGERASQALANLPYLRGFTAAPERESVTVYDPEAAFDGLNLVVSGHAPEASLQDMRGNTLHTWRCEAERVWPGLTAGDDRGARTWHPGHETFWRRAHVYPNGDLLAIFDGIGLIKLDRDSNLLWSYREGCHHDVFVAENGDIYTLNRSVRTEHDRFPLQGPILEDQIAVLDADGTEKRVVSILSCILDSPYAALLGYASRQGDILHTNTIELMDGRFADRHPLYAPGNVLISMPAINTIAVLDLERATVVWALGGLWRFQHQPTVLENGNILVFDNTGRAGRSSVIEIDPVTQRIAWVYGTGPDEVFSSFILGSSQRLPNGNTLITESVSGRAFEVTPGKEIVWEYVNPERAGDEDELIASLLEIVRIDRGYFDAAFAAAQHDYASGKRRLDLTQLETLIALLRR